MHTETRLSDNFFYIGGSDRRLALFENVYPLENGASYNSYLYLDEKTLVLDTVDESVRSVYFENIEFLLNGRKLDYLIVNHMEPDHASSIGELMLRYPETTIVTNEMAKKFLLNYFPKLENAKFLIVNNGDKLSIGKHVFTFVKAPMVHWPEVMFTYELTEKVLFSADAFGTFGALAGNVLATPKDYDAAHLAEMRRYYTNIVGKYGEQVTAVLKVAEDLEINMICPLHGPIHTGNLNFVLNPYKLWATYTPEDRDGVMIAYSSVYGDTANAATRLATRLAEKGLRNIVMYDVSKTDSSVLVAESFRVNTIVLAATTYNAGVFVKMEDFLHDLANHHIRNRTIAFIENGSWAPAAKANMQRILEGLDLNYIEKSLTIASSLKENQLDDLDEIAEAVVASVRPNEDKIEEEGKVLDLSAMFKLSYGLFVCSSVDENGRMDASINNSFFQVASTPNRVLLSVNKANKTADNIIATKKFAISVLSEEADFSIFKRFGFQSNHDGSVDKFAGIENDLGKTYNGLYYLKKATNAYFACNVVEMVDCGSHMLFIAKIDEARVLSNAPSVTYAFYFEHIKPKPIPSAPSKEKKIGWRCKICGYTYVGDTLPEGYVCPLCKHPASDFEKVEI